MILSLFERMATGKLVKRAELKIADSLIENERMLGHSLLSILAGATNTLYGVVAKILKEEELAAKS